jgi:hypothetical protein
VTDYFVDGYDLSHLFDSSLGSIEFSEDPRGHIPDNGSIIYSVWDKQQKFIYIGISGLQKSLEKRSPLSRMVSHASGRRSGDQFCIYVHDFYVIPKLVEKGMYKPSVGSLDKLTKDFIHTNLSYRFVKFDSDDSDLIVRKLENQIKSGILGFSPILNGSV